jgi:hypothetical protein
LSFPKFGYRPGSANGSGAAHLEDDEKTRRHHGIGKSLKPPIMRFRDFIDARRMRGA